MVEEKPAFVVRSLYTIYTCQVTWLSLQTKQLGIVCSRGVETDFVSLASSEKRIHIDASGYILLANLVSVTEDCYNELVYRSPSMQR